MVLTIWIGAYALVFGIFLLILAFQLHSRKEEREHKNAGCGKEGLSAFIFSAL